MFIIYFFGYEAKTQEHCILYRPGQSIYIKNKRISQDQQASKTLYIKRKIHRLMYMLPSDFQNHQIVIYLTRLQTVVRL